MHFDSIFFIYTHIQTGSQSWVIAKSHKEPRQQRDWYASYRKSLQCIRSSDSCDSYHHWSYKVNKIIDYIVITWMLLIRPGWSDKLRSGQCLWQSTSPDFGEVVRNFLCYVWESTRTQNFSCLVITVQWPQWGFNTYLMRWEQLSFFNLPKVIRTVIYSVTSNLLPKWDTV